MKRIILKVIIDVVILIVILIITRLVLLHEGNYFNPGLISTANEKTLLLLVIILWEDLYATSINVQFYTNFCPIAMPVIRHMAKARRFKHDRVSSKHNSITHILNNN